MTKKKKPDHRGSEMMLWAEAFTADCATVALHAFMDAFKEKLRAGADSLGDYEVRSLPPEREHVECVERENERLKVEIAKLVQETNQGALDTDLSGAGLVAAQEREDGIRDARADAAD